MIAVLRLLCLLVVAGLFAPSLTAQDTPKTPAPAKPGKVEKRTYDFKEAKKEMEYALYVPKKYDMGQKTPLVVVLHGLYSNPLQIMSYPGLTAQAEKYGYLLAAPMGYNSRGWYGAKIMVAGKSDDPKNLPELSEKDVLNVLEIVRKDYNVDPDRIYLMGHSMGGGTWHLGLKYPEKWAALAPIAPATLRPASDLAKIKSMPVFLVQGEKDVLVKVERVRPWAEEMKKLGMDYEYDEVAEGDHITVAFTELPRLFAFFDRHVRGQKVKAK